MAAKVAPAGAAGKPRLLDTFEASMALGFQKTKSGNKVGRVAGRGEVGRGGAARGGGAGAKQAWTKARGGAGGRSS